MPEFQYSGVDKAGKRVEGKLDAQTEGEIRMLLRTQGIRPTSIGKISAMNADLMTIFRRNFADVGTAALVNFTRQLQVLIGAGIPLIQGLEILSDQFTGSLQNIITIIKEKVSQGSFLWESVNQFPTVFPKIYVSLVRAGEASGSLDAILKRLTLYMERSEKIKRMVKSAMAYPMIVCGIAMGVVSFMIVFVIPKFEEMFKSSGHQLPGPTLFLINTSHFVGRNLYPIIIGTTVFGYIARRYLKSQEGKAFLDRVIYRTPIFGAMAQKSGIARFTRTLQTLLSSGVNLLDAIDICKDTMDNVVLEEAMVQIRVEIEGGKTLGMVVSKIPLFPRMASQMISVGESTGNLDKMLEKIADLYDDEVEQIVGGLGKAIEPLVIVFLGALVGGIMIAMYLPVFQQAGNIE